MMLTRRPRAPFRLLLISVFVFGVSQAAFGQVPAATPTPNPAIREATRPPGQETQNPTLPPGTQQIPPQAPPGTQPQAPAVPGATPLPVPDVPVADPTTVADPAIQRSDRPEVSASGTETTAADAKHDPAGRNFGQHSYVVFE